jgi:predicted AAA+ superfamily ATPase
VVPSVAYLRRLVDPLLDELLAHVPAVLIVGPRAAGKTTTAERRVRSVLRLGEPAQAAALASDVDAVLAAAELPALIDEWQLVPDILGAVKRAVDRGAAPGSYLLTGSSRADLQAEDGRRPVASCGYRCTA